MLTGIELGPSSCVLVRTRRERSLRGAAGSTIAAARVLDGRNRSTITSALGRARRDDGFSPRARVVAWGAPGSQIALDLDRLPDVSPLIEAGFEIESVVSPPQALAMMLESQRVDTRRAVAAVALNRQGAALAIVHHGQAVAARTFEWPLGEPFSGARSEPLERYLVISQLAPQLKHLIDLAAPVYNAAVSSVVLCGNLPDLRSLSMLLIEEMDLEVETLDSAEMLAPAVAQQTESAAGLQLAAAVASSHDQLSRARTAADERRAFSTVPAIRSLVGAAAFLLCASWASLQVAGSAPAVPAFPNGFAAAARAQPPALSAPKPEATIGRMDPEPVPPPVAAPSPRSESPRPQPIAAARPGAVEPLTASDPLPRVDGIAIFGDRRLAIVDGEIVAPGDLVGRRAVTRIEGNGVAFREPGGREIFVAIRSRKPPPGGP
jgi:hypothetical protein